jgi:transposase
VTPQRLGVIPDPQLTRLTEAKAALTEADEEYRQAVADALKAGGSVREVARVTGLSTSTVQAWGRERGWPTEEQQAARRARSEQVDEFDARLRAAQALNPRSDDE